MERTIFAALVVLALAASCAGERVEVGVDVHPAYWEARGLVNTGRAEADLMVPFSVAMRQQNLEQLRANLMAVSTPGSPTFRQYMTASQVADLVATSEADVARVFQWLLPLDPKANCNLGVTRDVLHCAAPVRLLEDLLATELFALDREGGSRAATISHVGRLSVPAAIADAVDLIQGLSMIPYRKAGNMHTVVGLDEMESFVSRRSFSAIRETTADATVRSVMASNSTCPTSSPVGCLSASGASQQFCCPENTLCCPNVASGGACCTGGYKCCDGECAATCTEDPADAILVTPQVLRDQYSVDPSLVATENFFNQSVVAFTDEYSSGALDYFNTIFGERMVPVTRYGPAGCLPNCDQVESDLDMQYMSSMGEGVGQWFWYNSDGYTLEWAQAVLAIENPPLVHSISYISGEYQLGPEYISRSNDELVKLGNIGASVMACSGDTGAPGWSINFPIDTRARNFPYPCPDCPLYPNLCNQVTVTVLNSLGQQSICNVPSGMYSRDIKRGLPCDFIGLNEDCQSAMAQFESTNSGTCGFEIVDDVHNIPRLFTESCTCDQLQSVSVGNCTVSGYEFDASNGAPLTSLYPASSPFVTAVGATQLAERTSAACGQSLVGTTIDCDVGEVACSIATNAFITSGGGFSTLSPMESYQTEAVSAYLAQNLPLPTGYFDSSLRAYPDVSFAGHNFVVEASVNSTEQCPCVAYVVDGTSCSSPGFAGLVSLLNQANILEGGQPLGFLNPWLYSLPPAAFHDVTYGDNYCTEELCSDNFGYVATHGWDPLTGLGTPIMNIMLDNV